MLIFCKQIRTEYCSL